MEYVNRSDAEDIIREAIDDYLPEGTLQEILDILYDEEYIVVGDGYESEEDEE